MGFLDAMGLGAFGRGGRMGPGMPPPGAYAPQPGGIWQGQGGGWGHPAMPTYMPQHPLPPGYQPEPPDNPNDPKPPVPFGFQDDAARQRWQQSYDAWAQRQGQGGQGGPGEDPNIRIGYPEQPWKSGPYNPQLPGMGMAQPDLNPTQQRDLAWRMQRPATPPNMQPLSGLVGGGLRR